MSVTPSQLSEIHKELIECFISHPTISVNPTKGDPPEEYDISYQIGGMSQSDSGEINELFGHTVSLTIPFGFPHFPPSCKPKSNIFHPDFDAAAICITTFWDQDQSLPELILNMGRMINGEIYSTSNVFNEEAGDWYVKHKEKFPLSDITWATVQEVKQTTSEESVDTLDDADLSSDFDFHDFEPGDFKAEEIALSDTFPEIDSSPLSEPDLSEISLLNKEKKYFELRQTIKGTTHSSDELLRLSDKCSEKIEVAEKLYEQASELESQGNAKQALSLFEQIASTVADFPSIRSDIKRVQQTPSFSKEVSPDLPDSEQLATDALSPQTETLDATIIPGKKLNKAKPVSEKSSSTTPFFQEKKKPSKFTLLAIAAIFFVGMAGCGYFWYVAGKNLEAAQKTADKCNSLFRDKSFAASKKVCQQGMDLVSKVKYIKQSEAQALRSSLTTILQSEQLSQGVAGKMLFDGKYLSKKEAEHQKRLNTTLEAAATAYAGEQWLEASKLYAELQKLLSSGKLTVTLTDEEIAQNITFSKFRIIYDDGMNLIITEKWEEALAKFKSAKPLIVQLSPDTKTEYNERLQENLSVCQFNNLKEKGDIAFSESRWQTASSYYSEALTYLGDNDQILPETVSDIQNNNKRAQLYKTITEGNQAFSSANWDAAIEAYDQAESFLNNNQDLLSQRNYRLGLKKIAKIRLQASIIRDQLLAEELLNDKMQRQARQVYLNIVQNIDKSGYGREEKFAKSRKEFIQIIEELDNDIDQKEKIDYLTDNYQSLFIAYYPGSSRNNLINPSVTFTKEIGSKSIFRMQCSEIGRGRPLTLIMFYAYDRQNGSWTHFTEH